MSIKKLLENLLLPKPIKGEPVNYRGQKTRTVMPEEGMKLLWWMRGGWHEHLNKKNK